METPSCSIWTVYSEIRKITQSHYILLCRWHTGQLQVGRGWGWGGGSSFHYDNENDSTWSWAVAKLNKCRWRLRFFFIRERNQDDSVFSFTSCFRNKFTIQHTCPGQLLPQSTPKGLGRLLEGDLSGILYRVTHMHHFTSSLPPSTPSTNVMNAQLGTNISDQIFADARHEICTTTLAFALCFSDGVK